MRVVSVGDLVLDYYYKNNKILGVNGGMTAHNIIANIQKMGIPTSVYGVCGNDVQGQVAIQSLKKLGVDTDNIIMMDNIRTRCFHVSYFEVDNKLSFTSKKRCPFCGEKKWYEKSLLDAEYVINNIKKDDIIVFDNLNDVNQKIIDNCVNKKIIDLGQYFEFEKIDNESIVNKLFNKFEIINFNQRVSDYLISRLNLKDELTLFKKLKPKFMTITKGDAGAVFIYDEHIYNFNLIKKGNVVDSTGAGDAFISSIIKDYIKSNYEFNVNNFDKWYNNSNILTSKVVSKMGARGHLNALYNVKNIENYCYCDSFLYSERKKIKRCNININNLQKRVLNAIDSSVCKKLNDIEFNLDDNCLFVGTGGSYAGAYFSSKVINLLCGCNSYALYPRDILYRNNTYINKIILFSYSGTTNDIITSVKDLMNKEVYVVTKGEIQKIVLKTGIPKKNILSYRSSTNKGKERGFLSFEGSLAPSAIFLKYYYSKIKPDFDVNNFIINSIEFWNKKLEKLINKEIVKNINNKSVINIFRGDFTDSACFDLESKIIESGICNCIIHEKKNFSHGRFINFENLNNDFSIYFKQNTTSKYEKELLQYLGNTLLIESNYDGILAEFDLLIASQFIIYYIGKVMDIDVSKPKYSDNAMKIYFYKGEL